MTEHDRLQEEAKYTALRRYRGLSKDELLIEQTLARERYRKQGPTHEATMSCEVIAKLLGEIE
jgi:hypothetical protein